LAAGLRSAQLDLRGKDRSLKGEGKGGKGDRREGKGDRKKAWESLRLQEQFPNPFNESRA